MRNLRRILGFLLITTIVFGIIAMNNHELYHFLIQLFSIFMGIIIFIVALNSTVYSERKLLLALAIVYVYVSMFDFLYMITINGVDFVSKSANTHTQYWMLARFLEAYGFIVLYYIYKRKLPISYSLSHLFYGLYVLLVVIIVQFFDILPLLIVNGESTILSYILDGLLIVSFGIAYILINRIEIKPNIKKTLSMSIILKIIVVIFFSRLLRHIDIVHVIAHLIMFYSYVLVYKVFISETIVNPYQRLEREFEDEKEELTYLAEHDLLTGIYNHTTTYKKVDELINKYKEKQPVAVILIDVDDFKIVNDTHGHLKGDVVLREFAQMLMTCDAPEKVVGRYGGDEFIIACAGVSKNDILGKFEKMRSKLQILCEDLHILFTFSAGVVFYENDATTKDLIYKADIKMYEAKRKGKNQFVIW